MKVVYSEKDQMIIDMQTRMLDHFDTVFLHTMKTCGKSPQEAQRELLGSPERAMLIEQFSITRANMSVKYIFEKI